MQWLSPVYKTLPFNSYATIERILCCSRKEAHQKFSDGQSCALLEKTSVHLCEGRSSLEAASKNITSAALGSVFGFTI